jgi:hypothetical protein
MFGNGIVIIKLPSVFILGTKSVGGKAGQLQLRIQVGCPLDWTVWHYAFPHRYGPLF